MPHNICGASLHMNIIFDVRNIKQDFKKISNLIVQHPTAILHNNPDNIL